MRRTRGGRKSSGRRSSYKNKYNTTKRNLSQYKKRHTPTRASMEKVARRGQNAAELGYHMAQFANQSGIADTVAGLAGHSDTLEYARQANNNARLGYKVGKQMHGDYHNIRKSHRVRNRVSGGKRRSKRRSSRRKSSRRKSSRRKSSRRKSSRRKSSRSTGKMRYVQIPKNLLTF